MSKTIICPVKHFAGEVDLKDPLPYLVTVRFEQVAREASGLADDIGAQFLPVLLDCVEQWRLSNIASPPTVDTFPGTPRPATLKLVAWLLNEVTALYKGNEESDPNA